jgi:hypothetical protein
LIYERKYASSPRPGGGILIVPPGTVFMISRTWEELSKSAASLK